MADASPPTSSPAPPLVSGVMIFLNGERFLREAIDSVLGQAYDNWELLLVDDGSTDGSGAIAREYARRDPARIRCLEHPGGANRGKSASRNLGMREARGSLVAFLDADDVWLSNKLAEQVPLLTSAPDALMLFGRTWIWHGWTGDPADAARDYATDFGPLTDRTVDGRELVAHFLASERHLPSTCSVLVRREAALGVGGFDESFKLAYEDMAFYTKLFLAGPAFVAGGCWDRYRQHPDSYCHVAVREGRHHPDLPNPDRGAYLAWVERYLDGRGERDARVRGALSRALWPYRHPTAFRWYRNARVLGRPLKAARRWMAGTT